MEGSDSDVATFRKKLAASGVDRDDWWRAADGEHEVTFAINLTTLEARLLRPGDEPANRDDWKAAFDPRVWLTGTIDWIHWGTDDTLAWVDDLKTGHWPVDPATSRQLRSYLLLPWWNAGRPVKWEGVVSITQWEKYPLDGRPKRKGHRLTGLDMMEHLESLRHALANPNEVNVIDTEPKGAISPCAFCPNRLEHPASSWMSNWKHRRLYACAAGIATRLERTE